MDSQCSLHVLAADAVVHDDSAVLLVRRTSPYDGDEGWRLHAGRLQYGDAQEACARTQGCCGGPAARVVWVRYAKTPTACGMCWREPCLPSGRLCVGLSSGSAGTPSCGITPRCTCSSAWSTNSSTRWSPGARSTRIARGWISRWKTSTKNAWPRSKRRPTASLRKTAAFSYVLFRGRNLTVLI